MRRILTLGLVLLMGAPVYADSYDSAGNLSAAGLTASTCVSIDNTSTMVSNPAPCAPRAQAFVISAVGGATMTITTQNLNVTYFAGQPLTISDGTNTIAGTVNASVTNSPTFTFRDTVIALGAAGNTMAAGATITAGGIANGLTFRNGSSIQGIRVSSFSGTTIAIAGTQVYTFGISYLVPPACVFTASATGLGLSVTAVSGTTVTVTNGSGVAQTPTGICIGY